MRSYRWRPQAPRAAAPAAPRAALLGSVWLGALAAFAPNAAQATDGTWIGGGAPVSNEWTQGNNWNSTPTPNTVPDDIATFTNNPGAPTLVTISSSTSSSTSINTHGCSAGLFVHHQSFRDLQHQWRGYCQQFRVRAGFHQQLFYVFQQRHGRKRGDYRQRQHILSRLELGRQLDHHQQRLW
jgi:hypothetical protein